MFHFPPTRQVRYGQTRVGRTASVRRLIDLLLDVCRRLDDNVR